MMATLGQVFADADILQSIALNSDLDGPLTASR